jgi:hypothetical protein
MKRTFTATQLVLLLTILISLSGIHSLAFTPPTPTPTCPPCMPLVESYLFEVDDTAGSCSDQDGRMDAGEVINLAVEFFNGYSASCAAEDCYCDVSVDHPKVTIKPAHMELGYFALHQSKVETFQVEIGDVACGERVTFSFRNTSLYCGSWVPWITRIEYDLEIDEESFGWTCDDTPCSSFTPPEDSGMELILDDTELCPGDEFHLHFFLHNATESILNTDVWIVLDVYGEYWFYPGWVHGSAGTDYLSAFETAPGNSRHESVLRFPWPEIQTSADGLYFHGAVFSAGTYTLIGDIQTITWSFSNGS